MTPRHSFTIGEALHTYRKLEGLSQVKLGLSVGTTRQTIASIEQGISNPGIMLSYLLAKRLGFSLGDVTPNFDTKSCACALFGPKECRVCFPEGYKKD